VIDPEEILEMHDPASDLEEREETVDRPIEDYSAAMGRLLSWFLEKRTLAMIGHRVLVATHKLRPDLIGGKSFQEIAGQSGFCRSAAHNLSEDFEQVFPIGKTRLDRSRLARLRYARSHHAPKNNQGPKPAR